MVIFKKFQFVVASQIEPKEYLKERVFGEAFGGLGECGAVAWVIHF